MSPLSISWHFVETQGAITCHNFPQNGSLFLPVKILQENKDLLILKLQLLFFIFLRIILPETYKYLSFEALKIDITYEFIIAVSSISISEFVMIYFSKNPLFLINKKIVYKPLFYYNICIMRFKVPKLGGVKTACKDPSFVQSLVIFAN